MKISSPKGARSWMSDVIENSAAVIVVMAPEIQHGLRIARKAISSHAEGITRQARSRSLSRVTAYTRR